MLQYIARRILLLLPTYWLVLTIVFLMLRVTPGDAVDMLFMERVADPADKERLREHLGLDKPIYIQYARWLIQLATGDLGQSLQRNKPVLELLQEAAPVSLRLNIMTMAIAWSLAFPIGIIAAAKADTKLDAILRGTAILLDSIPSFWVAVLVITIPAFLWGWTPNIRYLPFSVDPIGNLTFFIVPALILGTQSTSGLIRMTRAMLLEVLRSDYIRTARAKGLTENSVLLTHALKNAMIPIVTILGGHLSGIIGGSTVIENVFAIPGMGRMLFTGVQGKDVQVIQTSVAIFALFGMFMNLAVDISYAWLDPRMRYR